MHGDRDDLVPIEAAERLAKKLAHQKNVVVKFRQIAGADHAFSGHLPELAKAVGDYLDAALAPAS